MIRLPEGFEEVEREINEGFEALRREIAQLQKAPIVNTAETQPQGRERVLSLNRDGESRKLVIRDQGRNYTVALTKE